MKFKQCVCSLLLAAMLTVPVLADQAGTVIGNGVNLRTAPDSKAEVITVISKDTKLTVLGSENGWYRVQVHGLTGYMSASLVTVDPNATTAVLRTGTVTGALVNVRAGPSSDHARLTQVASGAKVTILDEKDGWYQIRLENNQEGWISGSLISVSSVPGSSAATTATTPPVTSSSPATTSVGTVTGTFVNLRKDPSTAATIVGSAVSGESLTILDRSGNWYYIQKGSLKAYISADYVRIGGTPAETTASTAESTASSASTEPPVTDMVCGWYATVTGSVVNLRSEPSTSSTIVAKAYSGETYRIIVVCGEWYQISYGEQQVYIHRDYLTPSEAAPATVGVITGSVVNVRNAPSADAQKISQLTAGTEVSVTELQNGWYRIITASGAEGYVSAEYVSLKFPAETSTSVSEPISEPTSETSSEPTSVQTEPPVSSSEPTTEFTYVVEPLTDTGIVIGAYVNVREKPTTESAVLALASKGKYVDVLGTVSDEWYQIRLGNVTGFISAQYVELGIVEYSRPLEGVISGNPISGRISTLDTTPGDLLLAEQICQYAKEFIGIPYVYGGSLPETGFDCSGFTKYVYAHFGIAIPRLQQYNAGTRVDKSELRPGDLVFFKTGSTDVGHVGLYIGYGQFIHAPAAGKSVCITDLDSDFYAARYVCATRIID